MALTRNINVIEQAMVEYVARVEQSISAYIVWIAMQDPDSWLLDRQILSFRFRDIGNPEILPGASGSFVIRPSRPNNTILEN